MKLSIIENYRYFDILIAKLRNLAFRNDGLYDSEEFGNFRDVRHF